MCRAAFRACKTARRKSPRNQSEVVDTATIIDNVRTASKRSVISLVEGTFFARTLLGTERVRRLRAGL
jgi:hypothetical protein